MSKSELYYHAPKSEWGDGPWQHEPDRDEWRDAATGFACLAVRNRAGAWCGYVAVPPGHPWHGKGYDAVEVDVHGGLTYANKTNGHICLALAPSELDNVWWLGFDCAHPFDIMPAMDAHMRRYAHKDDETRRPLRDVEVVLENPAPWLPRDEYRTLDYVKAECAHIAEQAALCRGSDAP